MHFYANQGGRSHALAPAFDRGTAPSSAGQGGDSTTQASGAQGAVEDGPNEPRRPDGSDDRRSGGEDEGLYRARVTTRRGTSASSQDHGATRHIRVPQDARSRREAEGEPSERVRAPVIVN